LQGNPPSSEEILQRRSSPQTTDRRKINRLRILHGRLVRLRWSIRASATRTYTIVLEPAEEGGYIVHVPALPEVATCGDTEAEAIQMAREAIELVLEHRASRGEDKPPA
jgi:antitoxin HicB